MAAVLAALALAAVLAGGFVAWPREGSPAPDASAAGSPPPGEIVPATLDAERVFGRFRLVPAGVDPERCGPPAPEGAVAVAVERQSGASLDPHRTSALFFEPRAVPPGYDVAHVEAVATTWSDGTTSDTFFAVAYHTPDGGFLRFEMTAFPRGCVVEVRNPAADEGVAIALARVDGFKALFFVPVGDQPGGHSAAWVVTDRMLATVEAPGMDPAALYEMVRFVAAACG